MKRILWAFVAVVASISLSGCGTMQVFGTKITPTFTEIPAPTNITPISTDKPTPAKIEPTATSTEPAKPTVDAGFRNPDNKATAPLFENGAWVMKNGDGLVMATWNVETKKWDYNAENIKVKQIIIGNIVDQSLIEPVLGPLPPDDPTTHFVDANGNRVDYGVGPESKHEMGESIGIVDLPITEMFVRFRGVVMEPRSYGEKFDWVAAVFEIPRVDTSIIIVSEMTSEQFQIEGSLGDSYLFIEHQKDDSPGHILYKQGWSGVSGMKIANAQLIGKMAMIFYFHDTAPLDPTDDYLRKSDIAARSFIDYISGTSNVVPALMSGGLPSGLAISIRFPESQLPK